MHSSQISWCNHHQAQHLILGRLRSILRNRCCVTVVDRSRSSPCSRSSLPPSPSTPPLRWCRCMRPAILLSPGPCTSCMLSGGSVAENTTLVFSDARWRGQHGHQQPLECGAVSHGSTFAVERSAWC
eukprot:6174246-Pleurochrysis_carterae.AAC.1